MWGTHSVVILLLWSMLCTQGTVVEMPSKPDSTQIPIPWTGLTHQDLWDEYSNIFRYGNRNAASHLWSSFLLQRSAQMTQDRLEFMFKGFCAISGSPVGPHDYNRYYLELSNVTGGKRGGYMHYCCWPCVCDTQDFIKVDTKTIMTAQGPKRYHFAVIGNPCDHAEKLREPFVQPRVYGRRQTTLANEAREVRCANSELQGATMSDNGYVIITMFFDLGADKGDTSMTVPQHPPQPGRMTLVDGVLVQNEYEYKNMCEDRAQNGYNSGMGEIFRKVAAISPISPVSLDGS